MELGLLVSCGTWSGGARYSVTLVLGRVLRIIPLRCLYSLVGVSTACVWVVEVCLFVPFNVIPWVA